MRCAVVLPSRGCNNSLCLQVLDLLLAPSPSLCPFISKAMVPPPAIALSVHQPSALPYLHDVLLHCLVLAYQLDLFPLQLALHLH